MMPQRDRSRLKGLFLGALWICLGLVAIAAGGVYFLTAYAAGPRQAVPEVMEIIPAGQSIVAAGEDPSVLRVLTLNLAHGRGEGFSQLLQRRRWIKFNLTAVAATLARERAHVVALQEADGPSLWSGRFDHVAFVARQAGYPLAVRGVHVAAPLTAYGTALLAATPMRKPVSITFAPSPPTFSKGFVSARVQWPGTTEAVVVVSVHLDFSRAAVRQEQAAELTRFLREQPHPMVIMGDFNCQWHDPQSPLRILAQRLNLAAYRPDADDLISYPDFDMRLDWILISSDLAFVGYRVLHDRLSDHLAVIARLRRRAY